MLNNSFLQKGDEFMAWKSTNIGLKSDWMDALCTLNMVALVASCGRFFSRTVAFISFDVLYSSMMQRSLGAGGGNG